MNWLKSVLLTRQDVNGEIPSCAGKVVILSHSDNASIRYLLQPYLHTQGERAILVNPETGVPWNLAASGIRKLIISRYLPKNWIREIRNFRATGGTVVYFMDDDLMDANVLLELPSAYARKIKKSATNQFHLLNDLCEEFWVGSQYLAAKYAQWSPKVLAPRTTHDQIGRAVVTAICYHGTASHQAELRWLPSVMSEVLAGKESLTFELFGDSAINKMYRHLPGVAVLHPMSWSNYLKYTQAVHRDIGLAPLLPTEFNKGRGVTKFFDYTRMGAVGIYSDVAPYRDFIRNGVDGLLVPNEPKLWKRTILELASDKHLRDRLLVAAQDRAMEMASTLEPLGVLSSS